MKIIHLPLFVSLLGCLLSCVESTEKQAVVSKVLETYSAPIFHKSHEPKKQNAPFSDAVQVGNTFYLSGQIGMDHAIRELVEGGIEAETKQVLENIKEVMAQHGFEMTAVIKTTVILDSI
jgi:2-iminobutanoate/2-iminopropanoate deaminase